MVQVDGEDVDTLCYEVTPGSTVIKLKASYLNSLSEGVHTLAIISSNGSAETQFTIIKPSSNSSSSTKYILPKTGIE